MLFEQIQSKFKENAHRNFVQDVQYWTCKKHPLHLVKCSFDITRYRPELFLQLGIDFPREIQSAVKKRQAEFLAGRFAVQMAIQASGIFPGGRTPQLPIGQYRAPMWPNNIVGSITHSTSKAMCVIGRSSDIESVGLDIEDIFSEELAADVAAQAHTQRERDILTAQGLPAHIATAVIFSAKESLFKAVFPFVKDYFGFEEARVCSFDLQENNLVLELSPYFAQQHNLPTRYSAFVQIDAEEIATCIIYDDASFIGEHRLPQRSGYQLGSRIG